MVALNSRKISGHTFRCVIKLSFRIIVNFITGDVGLIFEFIYQAQQDISSLKNIAGQTGKKLSSLASSFMTDFQDRSF